MLFNSIEYLFFLPLIFVIYWLLKKHIKAQNFLLLIASYFFYGLWDYRFLSLIVISSLADYLIGIQISKTNIKRQRKLFLGFSLLINLSFLFAFKYFNFFADSFYTLGTNFGWEVNPFTLNIVLPVGISFYTFQTLSYTIDIYQEKLKPTKSILNFFTYVAFFPQLVAGPIERAINLLPQFERKRTFNQQVAEDGMRQILWGFFKKVVIADSCAIYVDLIFENSADLNGGILILGAILFSFQIYCDFSGYSDIAIGTARLFGINLMQNFATPFFSRNIGEFWRRWHISLTTWFRDYLYIPLGGSRVKKIFQFRNILIIFLVSGFWHGANWTFIIWGLIHALIFIPSVILGKNRTHLNVVAEHSALPNLKELFSMLLTFGITSFAWIFFRASNLNESWYYIKNIFLMSKGEESYCRLVRSAGLKWVDHNILIGAIIIMIILEWYNRKNKHGLFRTFSNPISRYLLYLFLTFFVVEYFYRKSTFIYFQF